MAIDYGSLLGGGMSMIGSIAGGMMGDSGNKDAINMQKNMTTKSLIEGYNAQNLSSMYNAPYQQMGYAALAPYQQLLTGTTPQVNWDDTAAARLAQLSPNAAALERRKQELSSSTTGSREKQRAYAAELLDVNQQLAELADLQQRQSMYTATQNMQDPVAAGGYQQLYNEGWQQPYQDYLAGGKDYMGGQMDMLNQQSDRNLYGLASGANVGNAFSAPTINAGQAYVPGQLTPQQVGMNGQQMVAPTVQSSGVNGQNYGVTTQDVNQAFTQGQVNPNITVDLEALQNDPLYQFTLSQANEAARRGLSRSGILQSRAGTDVQADVAMRTAQNEIDRYYGREVDEYGRKVGNEERMFRSQGATADLGLQNAQRALQAQMYSQSNALQGDLASAGYAQQAALANAGYGMDAQRFNIGNDLAMQQFNAANDMNAQQFNLGNDLTTQQFNIGNNMQAQMANAGYNMDAQRLNYGRGADYYNRLAQLEGNLYSRGVEDYNRQYGLGVDYYNMYKGLGDQDYARQVDEQARYQNSYQNALANLGGAVGAGSNVAQNIGGQAINSAASYGQSAMNAGNNIAGMISTGAQQSGANISNVAAMPLQMYNSYQNNQQNQQYLDYLKNNNYQQYAANPLTNVYNPNSSW